MTDCTNILKYYYKYHDNMQMRDGNWLIKHGVQLTIMLERRTLQRF